MRERNSYVSNIEQFREVIKDLTERCRKEMREQNLENKTFLDFIDPIENKSNLFDLVGIFFFINFNIFY